MIESHSDQRRRIELANFLRAKRARLSPAEVGLPARARTRTKGLRREDVAELAATSVSWYTWLEQARAVNVSAELLDSISQALHLSSDERRHLFLLSHQALPVSRTTTLQTIVSSALQSVLDNLETFPAFVIGRYLDVIAWNKTAEAVFDKFLKTSEERKNWARYVLDQDNREFFVDWENFARCTLAVLRTDYGRFAWQDTDGEKFVEELKSEFCEFHTLWDNHDVAEKPHSRKEFLHWQVGHLEFDSTTLHSEENFEQRLVIYSSPRKSETSNKIMRLCEK